MKITQLSMVLIVLLGIMTTADVLLLRQNLQLRKQLQSDSRKPEEGMSLRAFMAKDLEGQPVQLGNTGSGPKRVYLYFTPACKYCREQFPYWKTIVKEAASHNLEVIGLVKEGEDKTALNAFLQEMACSSNSTTPLRVVFIPEALRSEYKLSATPITLIADNRGVIEQSWIGAWRANDFPQVNSALNFRVNSQ
jgi:peroxiredoxin